MHVVPALQREKNQQEFAWLAVMNVMEVINYLSYTQKGKMVRGKMMMPDAFQMFRFFSSCTSLLNHVFAFKVVGPW